MIDPRRGDLAETYAGNRLSVNDRVQLSGGYYDAEWLGGKSDCFGTVIAFIPGQNEEPAAVVRLDEPLTAGDVTADIVVLELRYKGAKWNKDGIVHVELCDFMPEPLPWKERRQGKWVEAAAMYQRL